MDSPSSDVAIADIRKEGDRSRGFLTTPWYRYLVGQGTTGSGPWVLATSPSLVNPYVAGTITYNASGTVPQVDANDENTVSVANVNTTVVSQDRAMLFVAHDRTSGGMSVGVMDATGGVVMALSGVANVTFSRVAGTGLACRTTAGVTPRSISVFSIALGAV